MAADVAFPFPPTIFRDAVREHYNRARAEQGLDPIAFDDRELELVFRISFRHTDRMIVIGETQSRARAATKRINELINERRRTCTAN